jgi:uncharacterized membrane protein SirB2
MDYATIKLMHQSAVILSGIGFAVRGVAALKGAGWTRSRLARTLPHLIDTILLLSAIALAVLLSLNPAHVPWLQAKIAGLLVYITLGMVALRNRFNTQTRAIALVLALSVLVWIASVAVLKNPMGFIAWVSLPSV